MKIFVISIIMVTLFGCASRQVLTLVDGAETVRVAKSDPADNYAEIGPITATDGGGCGLYGKKGTYNSAILRLKNKAFGMGGDYVQLVTITEPHLSGSCFKNKYIISGTVFKKSKELRSPLRIQDVTEASGAQKLRELKALLDEGILTQQEYETQKTEILEAGDLL